jgi:hypothetical protein
MQDKRADEALNFLSGPFIAVHGSSSERLSGMVRHMSASKPKVVEIKKKKIKTTKSKARRGSEKLREAANKVIGRDSKKIAEALSENGKKGQLQSIKFMYDLSEKGAEEDEHEGARKIRSMALELANSPQWTGPSPAEEQDEDGEKGES